jgi:hypothetical protein
MNWWEVIIQPISALIALIGLIVINLLVWVFAWGRGVGKVNTRLTVIEEKVNNPQILPDCNIIFTEIKEGLSNVGGKVETILTLMQVNQKTSERKRIKRNPKSTTSSSP